MKTAILLAIGIVIGITLSWIMRWLQQFGNTASAQVIRDEMDTDRRKNEPGKKNNQVHS